MKDTVALYEALCLFHGKEALPREFFDAIAPDEEGVNEMMVDANIALETARVFAEHGVK